MNPADATQPTICPAGGARRLWIKAALIVFSTVCLLVGSVIPVFREMFADFGAPLPFPTRLLLGARPLLLAFGIAAVVWSVVLSRISESERGNKVLKHACIVVLLVALLETVALFLPVFDLASVASTTNR